MKKEKDISTQKKYILPNYTIVQYKNAYLVIFSEIAKWLVLKNKLELEIFNKISNGNTIEDLINSKEFIISKIKHVITQIEAKNIENTIPVSSFEPKLHFHITNKCNLRCPHCYMKSGEAFDDELKIEEIKLMIDKFVSVNGKKMSLTGGEPLMRNDFIDVIKYATSKNISTTIFTNGCLWTDKDINELKKLNVDGIQISIDGYNEETNSKVRGINSFELTLSTLDKLYKAGFKIIIAITPQYNEVKINPNCFINFAKKILRRYENKIDISFSYNYMPGRNISQEQIDIISKEYFKIIEKIERKIYGNIELSTFVNSLKDNQIIDSCGYGNLNVLANGDLYFCDRIPDAKKICNIKEMNNLKSYIDFAYTSGKIDKFKPCNKCELKYICGGGCRAIYFNKFTKENGLDSFDYESLNERECSLNNKEKIYQLMIESNKYLYE